MKTKVDVIVTESGQAAHEMKRVAGATSIVTAVHGAPISARLAKTLTRPGELHRALASGANGERLVQCSPEGPQPPVCRESARRGVRAKLQRFAFLAETRTAAVSLGIELHAVEASKPDRPRRRFCRGGGMSADTLVSLRTGCCSPTGRARVLCRSQPPSGGPSGLRVRHVERPHGVPRTRISAVPRFTSTILKMRKGRRAADRATHPCRARD